MMLIIVIYANASEKIEGLKAFRPICAFASVLPLLSQEGCCARRHDRPANAAAVLILAVCGFRRHTKAAAAGGGERR